MKQEPNTPRSNAAAVMALAEQTADPLMVECQKLECENHSIESAARLACENTEDDGDPHFVKMNRRDFDALSAALDWRGQQIGQTTPKTNNYMSNTTDSKPTASAETGDVGRSSLASGSRLVTVDGEDGLEYIALSPAREIGGYHPHTVKIAKGAIAEIGQLRNLLQQMLDVAENADETGYVTDVGFVDLDKLHTQVRASLPANTKSSKPDQ